MSTIPSGQKFHTVASNINTVERGSALSNAGRETYTMQDIIDTVPGGLGGTQYVFVMANGTDVENAAELQAAYTTAQTMSPSSSNRITVIAAPANYNFSSNFIMGAEYINLVSLDGNRSIVFNGTATIQITANDVFVKGVDVLSKKFTIGDALSSLRVENCKGGDNSFGQGVTASGTFTSCTGGLFSFGGGGTASGTFTNCTGDVYSFGGQGGTASGTFTNCTATLFSFGSFASGTFTNCTAGSGAFGSGGTASGTFTNCTGGGGSFAGSGGTASGVFTNCTGGQYSFSSSGGILSGKLYYCRITSGTFWFVSGGGRTVLCIDGNNNQNNQ
jgi:hypothetical protein